MTRPLHVTLVLPRRARGTRVALRLACGHTVLRPVRCRRVGKLRLPVPLPTRVHCPWCGLRRAALGAP